MQAAQAVSNGAAEAPPAEVYLLISLPLTIFVCYHVCIYYLWSCVQAAYALLFVLERFGLELLGFPPFCIKKKKDLGLNLH